MDVLSPAATPDWLLTLLGLDAVAENDEVSLGGRTFVLRDGILRDTRLASETQAQTADAFGFKWNRRESFEQDGLLDKVRSWVRERYGEVDRASWWADYGDAPIVLDAGCGAGVGGMALFDGVLPRVRYLGADISTAIDVAADRFAGREGSSAFLQADLTRLPLPEGSVDVILSEGVMHHTDSTEGALKALATLLRPGGRFLFYVYRRKGPIREFTDDYVRDRVQDMAPEEAWKAIEPLTRLGIALGELGVEVEVPEDVELLGIPAGRHDVQRLFYWHVAKAFYDPAMTLESMNHINFDWYAPRNAQRQSLEEVLAWCDEAGLDVEHQDVQEAGITIGARRRA